MARSFEPVPIPTPPDPQVIERFWEKVAITHPNRCWEWQANRTPSGYGRFKMCSYTSVGAHRFAYAASFGVDPDDLMVCHECDNPACCNPFHLFLGTAKDNSDDKIAKGRLVVRDQRGSKNGNCRLKENDVRRIRALFEQGLNNQKIAARYGVTHSMISRIRTGRSWEHLK